MGIIYPVQAPICLQIRRSDVEGSKAAAMRLLNESWPPTEGIERAARATGTPFPAFIFRTVRVATAVG